MYKIGKHQSTSSVLSNLFTNKKILLGLIAIAITAILVPSISFAAEVLVTQGESLPEKVENAINEIVGEPVASPAAPSEDMSNYLCFTPENGTAKFQFCKNLEPKDINPIYYSVDEGQTWNKIELSTDYTITGPTYFKSNNPEGLSNAGNDFYHFSIDQNNKIKASGSVMSLLDDGTGKMSSFRETENCFSSLFYKCEGLVSAPKLPALVLGYSCYDYMFEGCSSLVDAPELPAIYLSEGCYEGMFSACTGLKNSPVLPATFLYDRCYAYMFEGCTSLEKAPNLPASELADSCYEYMFLNCSSLIESPILPATNLAQTSYECMFWGCSSLKKVIVNFTDWNETGNSTDDWLKDVTDSQECIFVCPKDLDATSVRDASHVPQNWTIQYIVSANIEGYNNVYDGLEHGINIVPKDPINPEIEYSRDGITWSDEPIKEKDVGMYTVYYKLTADGYFPTEGSSTIIITPKTDASANFVGSPYSKKYGDMDPNFQISFQGLAVGEDTPKLYEDYTIIRETGEDVTADGAPHKVIFNWINPNYTIAPIETTLTIIKTNKFKLVCDDASKVEYDEPDPQFTAHMEGLKFDDVLTESDYEIEKVSSNANPSEITLKPKFSPNVSDRIKNNYVIDDPSCFKTGTYKIYESPESSEFQFMVETYDSYYDGQWHEFSINVKNPASGASVLYKKDGDADWRTDPYSFKDVGEYKIYYQITHDGFADLEDTATLNIQKAPATVVPNAISKNEGEADPALTAKVYGLVEGESLESGADYTLERQPGEAPGMYDIYCIPADSETANNYDITGADSKFFIASAGAGGNTQNAEGGASGAKTGDMNGIILITVTIIGLASAGYVLSRKLRKN